MRISDWSSDVCSSDLADGGRHGVVDGADAGGDPGTVLVDQAAAAGQEAANGCCAAGGRVVMWPTFNPRSEEHTSELQSLMRNSYAVFRLKIHTNMQPITSPLTLTHEHLSATISTT